MYRSMCGLLLVLLFGACAPIPLHAPPNVSVGSGIPGSPVLEKSGAPPRIIAVRFNALDVAHPAIWSGTIVTTTNVASVELRTNQFSLNIPRTTFGVFRFRIRVYDLPAEFLRRYSLRIIARDAKGDAAEEDVPFTIR